MKINHHQFSLDTAERDRLWEEKRRHFADYCVNRFQWFHYPRWGHVADFPLHVDFEASFRCNLSCPMCFRPHISRKDYGDMDFALYQKGIDECAAHGLYSIRLSWRGESTLNPHLVEMVRYAKQKGIKEVSFITNGSLLEGGLAEGLIRAGLDYLTVSVDGLQPHYDRLRRPLTFSGTTERLKVFYRLKNALGEGYPRVKIQGIWTYLQEDPEAYYEHFKDITDHVSFDPENDYSLKTVCTESDFVCQYPWQRITVTWNGEIPLCISDWNLATSIGDLKTQSIAEVWNGEKMNDYRRTQLEHRILTIPCCQACHRPGIEQIGDKPAGRA